MPNRDVLLKTRCVKVVDGDTAWFEDEENKVVHKVRFIGIDTPETKHPKHGVQYYGPEASAFTEKSLLNKTCFLEYDIEEYDKYNRHLCYIWFEDETMFNITLLENGYATVTTFPPNVKYVDFFTAFQKSARENRLGIWHKGN